MADIDITGLDKAAVLAALHNGTRPLGMGFLHDLGRDMTTAEAQEHIDRATDDMGLDRRDALRFDYLCGRPLKVNLSGDSFDPRLYDRDAGEGAAARAIAAIREQAAA